MRKLTRLLPAALIVPLVLALVGPAATSDRWCVVSGELVEIKAELFYSGAWQDITDYVYTRDPINIARGVSNEATRSDPGSLTLTLDNRDGRFSPRNPRSPLYGLIGRNTPIRISAGIGAATKTVRFVGEVISWPARWDVSEQDRYVPIEAAGLLRRLGVPGAPLKSAIHRFVLANDAAAYWPLDDPQGSDRGLPVVGLVPMLASTRVDNQAVAEPAWGSQVLGSWLGGQHVGMQTHIHRQAAVATGAIGPAISGQAFTTGDSWAADFMIRNIGAEVIGLPTLDLHGSGHRVRLQLAAGSFSTLELLDPDTGATATVLDGSILATDVFDGRAHHVRVQMDQDGADLDWALYLDGTTLTSGTTVATTVGRVSGAVILDHVFTYVVDADIPDTPPEGVATIGELVVWNAAPTLADTVDAYFGYDGETATDRAQRLCSEEGVTLTVVGSEAGSTPMGPQRSRRFLELLDEAATAEAMGASLPILTETRSSLGLTWKPRRTFYRTS